MYFGRRNKKSSVSERAERATLDNAQFAPVATDERAALMATEPEEHPSETHDMTPPTSETLESARPTMQADPTQPLLTALGRFHREVTRAKDNPAEGWADACMQNLITAVDIALEHGWSDMVTTLTETARVLQTYENAHKASDAIAFLDESYEILCLMVGNILVGVTRSDAGDRWDTCHRKALEDLTSAGLTLVQDSGSAEVEDEVNDDVADDIEDDVATDEHEEVEPFDTGSDEASIDDSVSDDTDDEHFDVVDEAEGEEEIEVASKSTDEGATQALDSFCAALGGLEDGSEDADEMFGAMQDGLTFLEQHGESRQYTASVGACRTMKRLCVQAKNNGAPFDERFVEMAYAFCEAYMDGQNESADATSAWSIEAEAMLLTAECAPEVTETDEAPIVIDETPSDGIAPMDEIDSEPELDSSDISPEATDEALAESDFEDEGTVDDVDDESAPPIVLTDDETDDADFELSTDDYVPDEGTDGVVDEVTDTVEDDSVAAVQLLDEDEDDNSALRLLAVAQRAAAQGDIAGAKLLALRAATRIADDEASKSAADLINAERRLNEGADAVASAKNAVAESEVAVSDAEKTVLEAQEALDSAQGDAARIGDVIEGLETGIAALEAQIADLMAQKESEEAKLAEERDALAEADNRTAETQAELEARRVQEEEARRALEDARQQVKRNQERRTEIEREREEIQLLLVQQRGNVAELEQTILRTEGKSEQDDSDTPEENLLFDDM